jgi:putative transposase
MAHKKRARQDRAAYRTGAHTTHRLRVHLVWVPKYRRRVLEGPVAARLEALVRQAADVNRWQVHELAVQPDHVHLLLQIRPPESVASVAQRLKGGTSRVLRAEFPDLEEFLRGESFWADGYFAENVGQVEEAVVSRYIREQRQEPPPQRPREPCAYKSCWRLRP